MDRTGSDLMLGQTQPSTLPRSDDCQSTRFRWLPCAALLLAVVALLPRVGAADCPYVDHLSLGPSESTIEGSDTYRACETLTLLDGYTVGSAGEVLLEAGERVSFQPGVSVQAGGRLRARVGPLPESFWLEGAVVNAPVADATVTVFPATGPLTALGTTSTAGDGTFAVDLPQDAPFWVRSQGGTLGGDAYTGELWGWCPTLTGCLITPWSTVHHELVDAHGYTVENAGVLMEEPGFTADPFATTQPRFDRSAARAAIGDGDGLVGWVGAVTDWLQDPGQPLPAGVVLDPGEPVTRRLAIRPFGSGDIRATIEVPGAPGDAVVAWCGILPPGVDCYHDLPEGTNLRLLPQAAPGWEFSHWLGCDRTEETECVVQMGDEHRSVAPTFDYPGDVVLQPDVVLLAEATVDLLESMTESTLIFAGTAVEIQGLATGTVVLSMYGEGFARRVAGVLEQDGKFIVETLPVSLEDVIQDGVIVYRGTLSSEQLLRAAPAPGVRLLQPLSERGWDTTLQLVLNTEDNPWWEAQGYPPVEGTLALTLSPDFAFDIRLIGGVHQWRTAMDIDIQGSVEVELAGASAEIEATIYLGTYTFGGIALGPVIITTDVTPFVTVKGEVGVELKPGLVVNAGFGSGVQYLRGSGWEPVWSLRPPTLTPTGLDLQELNVSASAEAFGGVEVGLKLYSVVGPTFKMGPYVGPKLEYFPVQNCGIGNMVYGLRAKAGGAVTVLGYRLGSFEFTLYNNPGKTLLFDTCAQQELPVPEPPGRPQVEPWSSDALMLTFARSPSANADRYRIWREPIGAGPPAPVGTTTQASFLAWGLAANQEYCFHVTALDDQGRSSNAGATGCGRTPALGDVSPPSQPQALQVEGVTSTSIHLSWAESTDDVGVLGYAIAVGDNVVASLITEGQSQPRFGALVTGLQADRQYCLLVAAFDAAGNQSAWSGSICRTTLPAQGSGGSAGPLNDTGITWSGHATSGNAAFCDPAHPAGQDCHYGRDAQAAAGTLTKVGGGNAGFDFTKIANNGSVLPASATLGSGPNDWACTRDNVTGLIWEVKVDNSAHLRHQGHTYSWYDPASPDGNPGTQNNGICVGSACDTTGFVQAVNTQGLCGFSDWRMPTRRELQGIVDYGRHSPAIDTGYFPNTPGIFFWSGSPYADDSFYAWIVYFDHGGTNYDFSRGSRVRVRLVRGGQ